MHFFNIVAAFHINYQLMCCLFDKKVFKVWLKHELKRLREAGPSFCYLQCLSIGVANEYQNCIIKWYQLPLGLTHRH